MAAEKQIAAARADEVAMAAIRADPQILEEHLAVEATIDASRADAATWLAALNDSSWRFLDVFASYCLSLTNSSELCYLILPSNLLL